MRQQNGNQGVVVGCSPEEMGGAQAVSMLPPGYAGACRVVLDDLNEETVAVVPSPDESFRVARYAIGPDGYAVCVRIIPAQHSEVTHQSFMDWL